MEDEGERNKLGGKGCGTLIEMQHILKAN